MNDSRQMVRLLIASVVLCAWGLIALGTSRQQAYAQEKKGEEGKKGTTIGVLVGKDKAAIEVKADGEENARKYVPQWVGGAPAQGGGFDKNILKTFADLKVGSRIEVQWVYEERLRALSVKVLQAPEKK